MTAQLSRRAALLMWLALSLAVACGLAAAPRLDPLTSLVQRLGGSWGWAGGAHALLGALVVEAMARWLSPRPQRRLLLRLVGALTLLLALAQWLLPTLSGASPDARTLLWLHSLPLWWALAQLDAPGLAAPTEPASAAAAPSTPPTPTRPQPHVGQHLGPHGGLLGQIDMGHALDMAVDSPR